jgi:hypothetical protein
MELSIKRTENSSREAKFGVQRQRAVVESEKARLIDASDEIIQEIQVHKERALQEELEWDLKVMPVGRAVDPIMEHVLVVSIPSTGLEEAILQPLLHKYLEEIEQLFLNNICLTESLMPQY